MPKSLYIKNLGFINELKIKLLDGLNIIAGKMAGEKFYY